MEYLFKLSKSVFLKYRRILVVIRAVFSLVLPLFFVTYILQSVFLRSDYIFHSNIRAQTDLNSPDVRQLRFINGSNFQPLFKLADTFQNVTDNGKSLVFSAYLDDTKNSYKIRAIGVNDRSFYHDVFCRVWYRNTNLSARRSESEYLGYQVVTGYIDEHPEIFERSWAAVHYICPLSTLHVRPYAVSIVTTPIAEPLNVVKVNYPGDGDTRNYTICLHNAFNFKTDMSKEIVEWIELHTLLGADHFIVYNYSSHPQNDEILNFYVKKNIVTLIQWDIPVWTDLIFIGQVAVMTDCLYRNYYRSEFIAHLDLDEYIVPRRPGLSTVPELLSQMTPYCAYIARCNVFSVNDGMLKSDSFEGIESAKKFKLNTLLVKNKQNFIYGARDRSKIIQRTACIEQSGVHLINAYASGITSEVVLQPEDALMQHYRNGKPAFSKTGDKVQDDFMLQYSHDLISKVQSVWDNFQNKTLLNRLLDKNKLIYL